MKYILLAVSCLLVQSSIGQVILNLNAPIANYRSTVEQYLRFSPFDNNPDSFFVKMFHDDDFVLDTLIPHTDTVNFYMRGYYKTFNPFSLKTDRVEVSLMEYDITYKKTKTGKKGLQYQILGITGESTNDFETVKNEAKRVYKEIDKVVKETEIKKIKARGKTYLRYLYDIGPRYPMYSGFGQWYKNEKNFCVYFSINLAEVERLKRLEAML